MALPPTNRAENFTYKEQHIREGKSGKKKLELTLEDQIGCWTVSMDHNSLPVLSRIVKSTAFRCKQITLTKRPQDLLNELELLRRQVKTLNELTYDAIKRCKELVSEAQKKRSM